MEGDGGKDGRGVVEAVGGVRVEEDSMKGGFTVGKEYYGIMPKEGRKLRGGGCHFSS